MLRSLSLDALDCGSVEKLPVSFLWSGLFDKLRSPQICEPGGNCILDQSQTGMALVIPVVWEAEWEAEWVASVT